METLRQEAKERLLGHDEDPEQTHGFRETVLTRKGCLTILAGDADYADGSESLQTSEDASSSSVTNGFDLIFPGWLGSADPHNLVQGFYTRRVARRDVK
jgi:hypothetical protein